VIALVAWRARALTPSGALAAALVGTAVFGSGGWRNAAVLLAFFLSSTGLSHLGRATKKKLLDLGKTGPRDAAQVVANGGIAAVCALIGAGGNSLWTVAFAGAFAAAAADTWGTEIGTLGKGAPRSILSGKRVEAGLSGAITVRGVLAELCGAFFIAGVAWAARASPAFLAVAIGGFCGALADSLLGASLQALRYCRGCARYCETDPHRCGADTTLVRGAAWMGNDAVNFVSTAVGAAVAAAIYVLR